MKDSSNFQFTNYASINVYNDNNTTISLGFNPLSFGFYGNATYKNGSTASNLNAGFSLISGYYGGTGVSKKVGEWNFGFGIGAGNNYWGWNASATYKGFGAGYGQTYYGNAIGPDGLSNAQPVGSVTAIWKGGSFMLQNDLFALSNRGDKWRTNAWELTLGDFSIGNSIYTNDGQADSEKIYGKGIKAVDFDARSPIYGKNSQPGKGAWRIGKVFSAPTWIGYRVGGQISRIGYSFRGSQDLQQNGIHSRTGFGNQNYYLNYQDFHSGIYLNSGYYSPFSLWGH